jgi:hypothetical protein
MLPAPLDRSIALQTLARCVDRALINFTDERKHHLRLKMKTGQEHFACDLYKGCEASGRRASFTVVVGVVDLNSPEP